MPVAFCHFNPASLGLGRRWAALALALAAASAQAESAEAGPPRNVVQLAASASVQVQQDLLVLTLSATQDGEDAARLQAQLQRLLDAALAEARRSASPGQVQARSGDFGIHPRYGKEGRINGWQGRAQLLLSGRDFAGITALAGRVQGMAISQVAFDLSPAARQQAESQAQSEAIEAFKARAGALARGFGFAGYTLREVSVSSHENSPGPRPRMLAMAAKAAAPEADMALPVEAGKTQVEVTLSGSVQMR